MKSNASSSGRLVIALASDRDRQTIDRLRHEIHGRELVRQEECTSFDTYVVAVLNAEIAGFVGIRRCGLGCVEQLVPPADLDFCIDDGSYEIRWLTVVEGYRDRGIATLLMYAALRWIESLGGHRVIAAGCEEVKGSYLEAGLQPLIRRVRAGTVTFELMSATVEALRCRASRRGRLLSKLELGVEWDLGIPFQPSVAAGGGEVDPRADLRRLKAAGSWRSSRTSFRQGAARTTA